MRISLITAFLLALLSPAFAAPSMPSWNDASLRAWWKAHPEPESWPAAKAELVETLRATQLQYGTNRVLENPHFLGWIGHLRWIDSFPEGDPGFFADEAARRVFVGLSLKKDLPALLAGSLAPEDDPVKAVEIVCRIAKAHPETIEKFPELAVAIAVVFDRPFPGSWPHPFVKQEEVASGDLEVERRFEFFVHCQKSRLCMHDIDRLSVKELTYLVDSMVTFAEYEWAQQIQIDQPAHLASLYRMLAAKYDHGRSGQADYSWPHGTYSLMDIYEKGSICMDQAYFIAQTGKARGVPTVLFIGQGRSGGHAWVGFLKGRGQWELDVARIRDEKYPAGAMYDPQTWRRLTDSQFRFVMTDLMKETSFQRCQLALQWARYNEDQPTYREILAFARSHMSRYFVTWEMEADWLEEHPIPDGEMEAFWKRWILNFREETDMKTQGQIRLLKFYESRANERAAEKLKEEMLRENQSSRFDLAITIAAESVLASVSQGEWGDAEAGLSAAIERFQKNAGGHLFYNLVEPYVERCLEGGRRDLAKKAIAEMKQYVKAMPNSLLDADIGKLEEVVR